MEDLEGFLMEESSDFWPGSQELGSSFSFSLDAWWNGQISDLGGCYLDFVSLFKEGESPHQQHSSSAGSLFQNEEQNQLQQQQEPRQGDSFDLELISLLGEDESTHQASSSVGSINQMEQQKQHHPHHQGDGFIESDGLDLEHFPLLGEERQTPHSSVSVNSLDHMEQQEQQKLQQQQPQSNDDEEEDEEDEEFDSDNKKANGPNSKNLVSERNRRKRLNQQLFTLRSLVPNITKMDKRSILVDALAYLQSILQQIEREKENISVGEYSSCNDDSTIVTDEEIPALQPGQYVRCDSPPAILQIEVETLDEERFVLKIGCNRAVGALSQVQRVIESLGMEISCNSIHDLDQDQMLTTAFLRTRKKGVVTEERLKHRAKIMATKLGLLLPR